MTASFHRVPIPQPRETAFGYFRRFAAAMSYDSLRSFEHVAGLHEFGPTSGDAAWSRLAAITGLAADELAPLRWSLPGGSIGQDVVIGGATVRRHALALRRLRVCPACLREDGGEDDDGDVRRVHRRDWAFRHVVACPDHRILLTDACSCGRPYDAAGRAKRWACDCGLAMASRDTEAASERQIRAARAVECMLTGGEVDLPAPFRRLDVDTFLAFLDRYGRASRAENDAPRGSRKIKPGRLAGPAEPTLAECVPDVEAAMAIVDDWPRGLYRLLHDVAGRNADASTDVRRLALFATDTGHAMLGPLLRADGSPVRFIDRRVRFWLLAEHGYRHGERHLAPVSINERRKTAMPGRIRTPPERLTAAAAAMMLESAAERHRMRDWVAAGVIEPGEDGTFAFDDVDAILYVLLHAVSPWERHGDHAALRSVSLRDLGGAYTRPMLIADVFEGRLFVHAEVDSPNLSHLWARRDLLERRIRNQRLLDMAARDIWLPASTVARTIRSIWPEVADLNADAIRAMPKARSRHVERWHEGDCQNYIVHSATDVLTALIARHGGGASTGPRDTALDGIHDMVQTPARSAPAEASC